MSKTEKSGEGGWGGKDRTPPGFDVGDGRGFGLCGCSVIGHAGGRLCECSDSVRQLESCFQIPTKTGAGTEYSVEFSKNRNDVVRRLCSLVWIGTIVPRLGR